MDAAKVKELVQRLSDLLHTLFDEYCDGDDIMDTLGSLNDIIVAFDVGVEPPDYDVR